MMFKNNLKVVLFVLGFIFAVLMFSGAVSAASLNVTEVGVASSGASNYTATTGHAPGYVDISDKNSTAPSFLNTITTYTGQLNSNVTTPVTIASVSNPTGPSGTATGTLQRSEYVTIANNIKNFISANGRAPNYASSSLGNIRYESLIYMYSRILDYYRTNNQLPTSITVTNIAGVDSVGVVIDNMPPTVSNSLASSSYNTSKNVTLTATDDFDPNPVVYYSPDNGATWNNQIRTVTLALSSQGVTTLMYYGRDNKGNIGSTNTATYTIDLTAPSVTVNPAGGTYNSTQTVTLAVIDNLDPNPAIYYTTDGTAPTVSSTRYMNPISINALGTTILKFMAMDAAGNQAIVQTQTYILNLSLNVTEVELASEAVKNYVTATGHVPSYVTVFDKNSIISSFLNTLTTYTVELNNNVTTPVNIAIIGSASTPSGYATGTLQKSEYVTIANNVKNFISTNGRAPNYASSSLGNIRYESLIYMYSCILDYYRANNQLPSSVTVSNIAGVDSAGININYDSNLVSDINTGKMYSGIQDAVNDQSTLNGDTIRVQPGTYTENIVINKNLILMSVTGGNVTIQALNSSQPVLTINSGGNSTVIQGFTIKNASNNSSGISLNGASNCTITGNNLNNNYYGIYLSTANNNKIQDNDIINNYYGIFLTSSNNVIITGNTITNSTYGINPKNSQATIQFNRITGNSRFGIVSQNNSIITAINNWWGTNFPAYVKSTNWPTKADIYVEAGNVTYDPYVVLSITGSTATSSGNTGITADLTRNNQGEDFSSQGHVPNGIMANFTTTFGTIVNSAYTVKGMATTILNVGSAQPATATVSASVDSQSVSAIGTFTPGTSALIITSNALDNSTGQNLNITYTLPLNSSVSWLSVLWENTGLFQEEMNLIVNGNVVMNKTLINSAYLNYKNSYSQQVFNQITYFNALFTNSAEANLLLQMLITDNPQLQHLTGTQLTDGILAVIKQNNNFTDSEINFIKNNHGSFVDPINIGLCYTGEDGKSINITDPETNETLNLNFPGNSMSMGSSITYRNGSFVSQYLDSNNNPYLVVEPAGYEGVKSYAIATTKVTNDILQYWLNQASLYQPGAMKAAYGTFLTALLVEYSHDQVANNVTSDFNVTWSRTSPIVISSGDDALFTYLTLICDHGMGMTVIGLPDDMAAFRFACSSVISAIEQNVMDGLWFNYQVSTPAGHAGSVMTDMVNAFMNDTSLEAFESNGYVVLKAVGRDDLVFVIDPETGIVRDMNTANGCCGAYCYYDLQTDLAGDLGNALLNTSPAWLPLIEDAGGRGGGWIPPEWKKTLEKPKYKDQYDRKVLGDEMVDGGSNDDDGGKHPNLKKAVALFVVFCIITKLAYEPIIKYGIPAINYIKVTIQRSTELWL